VRYMLHDMSMKWTHILIETLLEKTSRYQHGNLQKYRQYSDQQGKNNKRNTSQHRTT
jgi:hypothetical protein